MRVVEGLVPPGGWHFMQKLRSSPQRPKSQRVDAATYDQLLEFVLRFRLNNIEIVPSGTATKESVAQDVLYYICGNYPGNCTGSKAQLNAMMLGERVVARSRSTDYRRPLTRIEDWLTNLQGHELKWVDQATATERAKICVECPLNQPWRTGCGACNDNAFRREILVRGSHQTGLEKHLKACVAYGTLNELSVWLADDHSSARRKVPIECWKAKEPVVS